MNPLLYIFANKGLHMSAGKLGAQVAHATAMALLDATPDERKLWRDAPARTVIILEARDETHMKNIERFLQQRGLTTYPIIDEGVNEIDPHVYTALASRVINGTDDVTRAAFGSFNLYRDTVRITLEVDK